MKHLIAGAIRFVVSNYLLTLFILGIVFSLVAIARSGKPATASLVVEKLLAWHVFFVVGVGYLVNFIFHSFFGRTAAAFIGWLTARFSLRSPPQVSAFHWSASLPRSEASTSGWLLSSGRRFSCSARLAVTSTR
jgi:hypothetical protein